MSISDFEQSLWELAILINPTHLANITTSKLNSYYQDTILDMRKVVLVQNLFNDIYNNWTDHQIRYQQNRRRQIENGEIVDQQLTDEESETNDSDIEYMSDEDGNPEVKINDQNELQKNQTMDKNNANTPITTTTTAGKESNSSINPPKRKDSVTHSLSSVPVKSINDNAKSLINKITNKSNKSASNNNTSDMNTITEEKNEKTNEADDEDNIPLSLVPKVKMELTKIKSNISKSFSKEQDNKKDISNNNTGLESTKPKEESRAPQIKLDFGNSSISTIQGNDNDNNTNNSNNSEQANDDTLSSHSVKKESSVKKEPTIKKLEREPRKDSLKASINLQREKSIEGAKNIYNNSNSISVISSRNNDKENNYYDHNVPTTTTIDNNKKEIQTKNNDNSTGVANGSFVIRSFNIPSSPSDKPKSSSPSMAPAEETSYKKISSSNQAIPVRKSSTKNKLYKVPVKFSQKLTSSTPTSTSTTTPTLTTTNTKQTKDGLSSSKITNNSSDEDNVNVHLRPIKPFNGEGPPSIQRRSMDDLLFQFADVMDIVSLIPQIVGGDDDDSLGKDLPYKSSQLNSRSVTENGEKNEITEVVRRRPSRAPTPPPTVVSNGKEYDVYSLPSERHQKYIKKKEEMEKKNKRRSSLTFEYHEFEELKQQQELEGYEILDTATPITKKEEKSKKSSHKKSSISPFKRSSSIQNSLINKKSSSSPSLSSSTTPIQNSNLNSPSLSSPSLSNKSSKSSNNNRKIDMLSSCKNSSSSNNNNHSSTTSRATRFLNSLNPTKSKSKSNKSKSNNNHNNNNNNDISTPHISTTTSVSSTSSPSSDGSDGNKENVIPNYLVRKNKNSNSTSNSSTTSPSQQSVSGQSSRNYHRYNHTSNTSPSISSSSSPTATSATSPALSSNSHSSRKLFSSSSKSYSSPSLNSTLYDLPHLSSLSSIDNKSISGSKNRYQDRNLPLSKSSPGLFDTSTSSSSSSTLPMTTTSASSNKKKANEPKSPKGQISEIDKFFDNVFRIDWSL